MRLVDSRLLGRGHELRPQVPPRPRPVRPRLRAPADGRRLGAGRHALRVRRGVEGQEPVLDRQARRRSRSPPSISTSTAGSAASSRPTSGSTSWSAAWATSPARWTRRLKLLFLVRLIPLCRAQLQPRRARPARHRQELRRPGGLAVLGAAHRADDRRQPLRPHDRAGRRAWCRSGTSSASTRSPTSRRCRRRSSRR